MKPSAFLSTLWRRVAKDGDYVFMSFKKGKKGEKPPFMPGFEAKGMSKDDAKALVEYMQSLRQPK